jgi:nucleotide-binding universal stress UspA family protein
MARKRPNPIVRAVTDAMWKRDQLQMQAADRLLSAIESRRRPAQEPRRRPARRGAGFHSVLCPIDFSEQSRLALRYAEAVARRGGARLIVSYANDPLLVAAAAAALHDRRLSQRSVSELRTFIDATLKPDASKRLRLKTQVSVGSPADEILKAAARGGFDLIVMGTHGLTGANRLLMGSTTLSVLQRTTIPVLAVPWTADASNAGPSPSWPGERIAAALELGDSAAGADVEVAARLAKWFGSSLLLLHVVGDIAAPEWLGGDLSAAERIRVAHAQQQVDALATRALRTVRTEGRVSCGRIADEIAALVEAEHIELLITALRDRRGWFGARRGSVSYHVLSHAVSPVLAYPRQWPP